jgi:hypothetical protein
VNDAPVAAADAATVAEDSGATAIAVLANDNSGPDAGETLSVTSVTQGSNGTVSFTASGVSYTPAANFNGSDSFSYTIGDGNGGSATANVNVTVTSVNDAPSFTAGADQSRPVNSGAQTVTGWASAISAGAANEGAQALNFSVSNDNTALFSVQPALSAAGTLTFTAAAGATGSATVSVQLHDNGGTANGGVDTSAVETFTITITPPPTLTIAGASEIEGNSGTTPFEFVVTLSPAASSNVTVNYQTLNGTAGTPKDYVSTSGTLTFTPGQVTKTIVVSVKGETTKENNETFAVRLSNATNALIGDNEALGIIVDDDKTPQLSVSSAKKVEGDSGESTMLFAITPTNDTYEPMTVTYTTVQGVEAREGVDYVPVTGTVVFPPETLEPQFIRVPIVGDKRHERTQKFLVRLVGALGAVLDGADAVGEIEDDDPVPTLSISDVSVGEANSGTVKAALKVSLSNETDQVVTVHYTTAGNSAVAGADFEAASGVLTFEPGTTNHVITIDVNPASGIEEIETFYVELTDAAGATLEKARGVVTITPPEAWVTSTTAEFSLGTLGAGGYLAETSGGEITLAPTVGTEFSGTALPEGWTNTILATGGAFTVDSGALTIDGASVLAPSIYGVGHTIEFVATFSGQPNQNAGFGLTTALLPPFAMFGVKADGQFYARSVAPGQVHETLMPGNWFNTPHRFRIDWNAGTVVFWIDGTQRAVHATSYKGATSSMRPAITDLTAGDGALSVDWMRMTAYAASGSYTSPVFDAGALVSWLAASWVADRPAGTSVVVEVRTGSSADPAAADGNWTAFTAVAPGALLTGTSQYAQYRVTLATTVPNAAPALKEVTVTFQK